MIEKINFDSFLSTFRIFIAYALLSVFRIFIFIVESQIKYGLITQGIVEEIQKYATNYETIWILLMGNF